MQVGIGQLYKRTCLENSVQKIVLFQHFLELAEIWKLGDDKLPPA